MAIKKSELYRKLWASCDELRGGMDASQYKDYVLMMLFIKYVSDKYAGDPFAPIRVPDGASFADMVALKGKTDIGDRINKEVIAPLQKAAKLSSVPDFNDEVKLGKGKEMKDRLTNLVAIFEDPALDFSSNKADDDDLLGDAYEYLMRHFATESGKSKGQFYTPSEVSRVLAQVLDISSANTTSQTTVYDPTCGSGSLLLKVGTAATSKLTLYGQEKDATTAGLARMNMILHDYASADIRQGNTLAAPEFEDGTQLKRFDYVVANPPFSDKRWSNGVFEDSKDKYERFTGFGTPPDKQGDYAYLLHIVKSLKSTGQGACILPHGVLFRGNAEADIRQNLIKRGLIRGIIGLPANLFYGTGIPACIIVLDKRGAATRNGIFMLDASKGFMKDGNKNRLRERDIHQLVRVFTQQLDVAHYARLVPNAEIKANDYNLNIPRYISSPNTEPVQDIAAHLQGGIPQADVDALQEVWDVCPDLRHALFSDLRPGYVQLNVAPDAVQPTIQQHPQMAQFVMQVASTWANWITEADTAFNALDKGSVPQTLITQLGDRLLALFAEVPLLDRYALYQHLLDYWNTTLQDDVYLVSADGWQAEPYRIIETVKGKTKDKGWTCDLLPKAVLLVERFATEDQAMAELRSAVEQATSTRAALEEEHSGEDGAYADLEKVNKASVTKQLKTNGLAADDRSALQAWLTASAAEAAAKKALRTAEADLDATLYAAYPTLTSAKIKQLVINDKWLLALQQALDSEQARLRQTLTQQVQALAERYAQPLGDLSAAVAAQEAKVQAHLEKMGFAWQ